MNNVTSRLDVIMAVQKVGHTLPSEQPQSLESCRTHPEMCEKDQYSSINLLCTLQITKE